MEGNKKIIIIFAVLSLLCMYYLGLGIFFMLMKTAGLLIRILAVVIPAVLTAAALSFLTWRIIIAVKHSKA